MRIYETIFILTPMLSDAQVKESTKKYLSWLKKNGAEVLYKETMGMKNLAYSIDGKMSGMYYLIEFEAEGNLIIQLDTAFKRDEQVIRHLIVRQDKHSLAYNEKRRALVAESQDTTAVEETKAQK